MPGKLSQLHWYIIPLWVRVPDLAYTDHIVLSLDRGSLREQNAERAMKKNCQAHFFGDLD